MEINKDTFKVDLSKLSDEQLKFLYNHAKLMYMEFNRILSERRDKKVKDKEK